MEIQINGLIEGIEVERREEMGGRGRGRGGRKREGEVGYGNNNCVKFRNGNTNKR